MSLYEKYFENCNCFSIMKNNAWYSFEYLLNDKGTAAFHFQNGTVVHAKDINHAKILMKNTLDSYMSIGKYWANELEYNSWEVQYSTAALPAVSVTVTAITGHEASKKGIESIKNDLDKMDLIKIL